jgi:hypothetical protein
VLSAGNEFYSVSSVFCINSLEVKYLYICNLNKTKQFVESNHVLKYELKPISLAPAKSNQKFLFTLVHFACPCSVPAATGPVQLEAHIALSQLSCCASDGELLLYSTIRSMQHLRTKQEAK